MKSLKTMLIFAALALPGAVLYAEFDNTGCSARAAGMGNAFTALADDACALYYNPAALGQLDHREFTAGFSKRYTGLDDGSDPGEGVYGYAQPLGKAPRWLQRFLPGVDELGGAGIGYTNLNIGGGLYSEQVVTLSYGTPLLRALPLQAGVNLKLLSKKYSSDEYTENAVDFLGNSYGRDPVFSSGYSKTGFGLDLAGYYAVSKAFSAGLLLRNINQPDMGMIEASPLPATVILGGCYRGPSRNAVIDVEYKDGDSAVSAGGEQWFMSGACAARAGIQTGSRDLLNVSAGFSLRYRQVSLDYAFIWPLKGIQDTNGSHIVGITARLGRE